MLGKYIVGMLQVIFYFHFFFIIHFHSFLPIHETPINAAVITLKYQVNLWVSDHRWHFCELQRVSRTVCIVLQFQSVAMCTVQSCL